MCGRYVFITPAEAMLRLFGLDVPKGEPSRFNMAPGQYGWIARAAASGEAMEAARVRWGLVPDWAKDANVGYKMINARSETAAEKPAFREAMRSRRCLIPSHAFYEWEGAKPPKQPYLIYAEDRSPLVFAGLWERWEHGGEALETFSVLTTAADKAIAWLHPRMPVVLPEEAWEPWVLGRQKTAHAVLANPRKVPWAWHQVSPKVDAVKNDSVELVKRWEAPQGSLL